MPTPVNHLVMAQELIAAGDLTPHAHSLVTAHRGPFLLGHTAPDVQTVSGQTRGSTHFYEIPPRDDTPAPRAFLAAHPQLARAAQLDPAHAAFLAGYLAHLQVDEAWWREVFAPLFGPAAGWGEWEERLFLHNVLRTHLDRADQARLDRDIAPTLAATEPAGWLPFVSDEALRRWRDLLVEQLTPGQHVRTAEVFAERMRVPAEAVEEALRSPVQMERLFRHAPPQRLAAYRADALRRGAALVNDYLGGRL